MRIKVQLTFVANSATVPIFKIATAHPAELGLRVLGPILKETLESRQTAGINVEPGARISVTNLDRPVRVRRASPRRKK